ncbi:MAG TPA: response regulator [Anaeromyxobacteraceae bacterium]|nr:response regulator [Anaeromyxobacteraceae bacterium]
MRPRVLVVEDDDDIRSVMAEALEAEGYEVAGARDGAEAQRRARECRPDLILLDLMMPGMDGWAFRAWQRADAALCDVPVVIVSATPPADSAGLDAVAHLQKSFTLEDLFREVLLRARGGEAGRVPFPDLERDPAGPRPGAGARPAADARTSS